jgi:hypothetical protein
MRALQNNIIYESSQNYGKTYSCIYNNKLSAPVHIDEVREISSSDIQLNSKTKTKTPSCLA